MTAVMRVWTPEGGNNSTTTSRKNKRFPTLEIGVVGEPGVGKTSLSTLCDTAMFNDALTSTVGIDTIQCLATSKTGEQYRLNIHDTAGQERYQSLSATYLRNIDIGVIVYDVTDEASFARVDHWADFLNDTHLKGDKRERDLHIVLVGNKTDMVGKTLAPSTSIIDMQRGNAAATKIKASGFAETSALNQTGFGALVVSFADLGDVIFKMAEHALQEEKRKKRREKIANLNAPDQPQQWCRC